MILRGPKSVLYSVHTANIQKKCTVNWELWVGALLMTVCFDVGAALQNNTNRIVLESFISFFSPAHNRA